MTVSMTGAGGFLGWHTRAYLHSIGERDVKSFSVGEAFELDTAASALTGADKLILLAGINRGTDDEVRDGNITFAEQTASVLRTVISPLNSSFSPTRARRATAPCTVARRSNPARSSE